MKSENKKHFKEKDYIEDTEPKKKKHAENMLNNNKGQKKAPKKLSMNDDAKILNEKVTSKGNKHPNKASKTNDKNKKSTSNLNKKNKSNNVPIKKNINKKNDLNSDIRKKNNSNLRKNYQNASKNLSKKEVEKDKDISIEDDSLKNVFVSLHKKDVFIKKWHFRKYVRYFLIIIGVILLLTLIFGGTMLYLKNKEIEREAILKKKQEELVLQINAHYNDYVLVKEDSVLYRIDENNNYYEYGIVYANTEIILGEMEITHLTEYFYSSDLDCYIKYENLEPIENLSQYSNRYKKYIIFNQNVVTNEDFTLYDDGNKVYSFNESMSFPIIIKNDDGKYYIEFNNRLLYILKEDIKEIINANNTNSKNASRITTLCYHRIYDTNEKCNDLYICKKKSRFDKEMKYLKDNNYLTLTMEEMYFYLTKKIQVPRKSVVITLDDGYLFESAIEVLEKYELNGTGFIKTGSFTDFTVFESPYFELQSHTDKMHVAGTCPRESSYQQGGGILCLSENYVLNDLKTSREKLNGAIAFAYPFYDYNTRAINLVKKSGFKLAFIGANSVGGRSYPGINTYKVPRMTIWDTTSFETFKSYVIN